MTIVYLTLSYHVWNVFGKLEDELTNWHHLTQKLYPDVMSKCIFTPCDLYMSPGVSFNIF